MEFENLAELNGVKLIKKLEKKHFMFQWREIQIPVTTDNKRAINILAKAIAVIAGFSRNYFYNKQADYTLKNVDLLKHCGNVNFVVIKSQALGLRQAKSFIRRSPFLIQAEKKERIEMLENMAKIIATQIHDIKDASGRKIKDDKDDVEPSDKEEIPQEPPTDKISDISLDKTLQDILSELQKIREFNEDTCNFIRTLVIALNGEPKAKVTY